MAAWRTVLYHRAAFDYGVTAVLVKILTLALLLALGGCRFIYKIDIQQGNLIDQEMVDDLKPGMTKRQVSIVLGTPAVESPFRQDVWNYVNTTYNGEQRKIKKVLSLEFEDNRLVKIEGDYRPSDGDADSASDPLGEDTTESP